MTRVSDTVVQFTSPRSVRSGRGLEPIKMHEFTLNFDHASVDVASLTATVDATVGDDGTTFPADAVILDWAREVEIAFAGPAIASIVMDAGDAGDVDELSAAANLAVAGGFLKTSRGIYGRKLHVVPLSIADLVGANTYAARYHHRGPTVTFERITTVASAALNNNATVTTAIGTTDAGLVAVTNGVVTIASAGAAGDIDSATPTAANSLADGSYLRAIVGGTNSTAAHAEAVLELREAVRNPVVEASAYGLRLTLTAVGANLSVLTAGRVKFYVAYQCLENPKAA